MLSNRVVVTFPITKGAITVKMVLMEAERAKQKTVSVCGLSNIERDV